ncbi:hypothetical protein [Nonomuraea sp. GTA35]|uniref:hypothetical protein n=1 Tax=Nonomuraea sp. GTA35 TaxID=1676746 RepID=UPI0035C21D16
MTADRAQELREAISEADEETFATLEEVAAHELMRLWADLRSAIRNAASGYWSINCEQIAYRIAVLTRALGKATPWESIPVDLLADGVYQRMHDLMGIPYEQPDMQRVAEIIARRETAGR